MAIAERDVAETQVAQAKEYVDFLLSKTLNSDAYYYLLGLAKEILEVYLHHANRMAWLAERALENETRQAYDLIAIDYTTQDELADLTRAQQITADLEALRSEYVAGQTARLQEMKWTIALSQLDPIAWRDLRDTGTATFVLRQRMIDRHFPGHPPAPAEGRAPDHRGPGAPRGSPWAAGQSGGVLGARPQRAGVHGRPGQDRLGHHQPGGEQDVCAV